MNILLAPILGTAMNMDSQPQNWLLNLGVMVVVFVAALALLKLVK